MSDPTGNLAWAESTTISRFLFTVAFSQSQKGQADKSGSKFKGHGKENHRHSGRKVSPSDEVYTTLSGLYLNANIPTHSLSHLSLLLAE